MLAFWKLLVATSMVMSASSDDIVLPPYRLPRSLLPNHYDLNILTDLENFTFSGDVRIQVECKEETDTIKLHLVSLLVTDEDVTVMKLLDNTQIPVISTTLDVENEFYIIKVSEKLELNDSYVLHIPFFGNITQGLAGFYRSSYNDSASNTTKWLAVTQFESTDARRAFPCFDEPAMKAKFRVRLGHQGHLKAISNMPLKTKEPHDTKLGWFWSEFEETVPMSTYLVAYIVSEFQYRTSPPEPNNVEFRVWARRDAMDQVQFAQTYGHKFLDFYEVFFNKSYPLPKQDMVAIPDFSSGAMENWGLITFRESLLLFAKNKSSENILYHIANTIAHELAHQWFGNLVTMKWWTDIWLNEGFATYVASLALEKQFPDWNPYSFEVASNLMDVFELDALVSSHPVSVPIGHPDEIDQLFDSISYNKGALLLHMMKSFLGDNVFQTGVSSYIQRFQYKNSEQDNLWDSFTEAARESGVLPSGVSVKDIMDTWTLQTGFPVLTVKRNKNTITVSQERYLSIMKPKSDVAVTGRWWIPVWYLTTAELDSQTSSSDNQRPLWMSSNQTELSFQTNAGPDHWILLNDKAAGLYHVNYDNHTWSLLSDMLHQTDVTRVHELSRFTLILDAMAMAKVGQLDYSTALRVLKYIRREKAYTPWRAAQAALGEIKTILWRTEKNIEYKKLVKFLLEDIYNDFGELSSVPEGLENIRHKVMIAQMACDNNVGNCSTDAYQLFRTWMTSNNDMNPIPKDLRFVVYCESVRQGTEEEWEFIWEKYRSTHLAGEKLTFQSVLACTTNETLLKRFLELSINLHSGIRRQDAQSVFSRIVARSPLGFRIGWEFLKNNIQKLHDYLAPNTQDLGRYVSDIAGRLIFPDEVQEMNHFVTTHKGLLEKSQLNIKQGLETADANLAWMKNFYSEISKSMAV